MTTYIALLRGINVGGRQSVRMEQLRALFLSLGHESVTTYLQSGNVIFTSATGDPGQLTAGIEACIAERLDLSVTVLTLDASELADVVKRNPFLDRPVDRSHLHVTFLADLPDRSAVLRMDATHHQPDELVVVERQVYLHCPDGYGRTKLTNAFFERQLGVVATTRNWRTVTRFADLTSAGEKAG